MGGSAPQAMQPQARFAQRVGKRCDPSEAKRCNTATHAKRNDAQAEPHQPPSHPQAETVRPRTPRERREPKVFPDTTAVDSAKMLLIDYAAIPHAWANNICV